MMDQVVIRIGPASVDRLLQGIEVEGHLDEPRSDMAVGGTDHHSCAEPPDAELVVHLVVRARSLRVLIVVSVALTHRKPASPMTRIRRSPVHFVTLPRHGEAGAKPCASRRGQGRSRGAA